MARRSSHRGGGGRSHRRPRSPGRREARSAPGEPELLRDVRRRLGTGEPLDLLAHVSVLLASVDPRRRSPIERAASGGADAELSAAELVMTFADVNLPETSALLACAAQLAPDELTRTRARRGLGGRPHRLPEWLAQLDRAEARRCAVMTDVLGDGDNMMVGVRLAGGHELTALLYIDHNLGVVAKDGFVVPMPIAEMIRHMREHEHAPRGTRFDDVDPADARARMTEAIEHGAMMFPPFETDTWPGSRPLIEWIAGLLPEGGSGYERPEWDEAAQERLTEDFFASEFGRELDDPDHRSLFESILWYGTDYGPGDPLHWSPVALEILLLDWIPRKIIAPADHLARAPRLLDALIRYAHAQRGIPAERTAETLEALEAHTPEYQQLIRSPRPQGPFALLAAMGAMDPDGPWELPAAGPFDISAHMLGLLAAEAGGEQALASLSDRPLPDEAFAWDGIAADIEPRVNEVLALCDRCCAELLDAEYRTACRRYLRMIACGDPEVFRRRGAAHTAAAAICWTIGSANGLFDPAHGGLLVRDLLAHFGIMQGSVSQRAMTLMRAAGLRDADDHSPAWEIRLGTPELLVSAYRRQMIERRNRYSA